MGKMRNPHAKWPLVVVFLHLHLATGRQLSEPVYSDDAFDVANSGNRFLQRSAEADSDDDDQSFTG